MRSISEYRLPLNARELCHAIAGAGFLTLFPGFVIYHYFVVSEWIAPFAGGLFGVTALAVAVGCIGVSVWLLSRHVWGGLPQAWFFLLSWAFFAVWTLIGYAAIHEQAYAVATLQESVSTLIIWVAVFFIGSFFKPESRRQRLLLFLSSIAVVALLGHAMLVHASFLGPFLAFAANPDANAQASTYQGIGRSVLVIAITLAALPSRPWVQLLTMSLAIVLLIVLGSRSHLFAMLCVVLATMAVAARSMRRWPVLLAFVLAGGAGVYAGWEAFQETRIAELFDLASSTSWQARQEVQRIALDVIRSSPVAGEFGYYLRDVGEGGSAHNALSAWTQFGLAGFLLYCSLIIYFTAVSLRSVLSPQGSTVLWRIAFGLNTSVFVLAIAAEQVFSVLPALAWGFAVNALMHDRETSVDYPNA